LRTAGKIEFLTHSNQVRVTQLRVGCDESAELNIVTASDAGERIARPNPNGSLIGLRLTGVRCGVDPRHRGSPLFPICTFD
jgi:hypothetical protein